jgi:hypothetical protein
MDNKTDIQKAAQEMAKAGASKGGIKRAESLSPEKRSEIARLAVNARWERAGKIKDKSQLLKATHEGPLKIGGVIVQCAVLENGQRVINQSGFMKALGRQRQAKGRQYYDSDVNLPAFLTAKNLKPFITEDLTKTSSQIEYRTLRGAIAFGYPAELVPKVCDVFLDAEEAGIITKNQQHIVSQAKILIRGLAHVGITALVDEATGYQADRARDALERILELFIAKEYQKWLKTFPDDFYEQMFRLRKWSYNPLSVKRPNLVGKYTNDLVYERLAPGVLDELKRVNPKTESGHRRHKYFQWLTTDIGHPRLREHLTAVVALMRASDSWNSFVKAINRALPKPQSQTELTGPGFDEKDSGESV